MARGPLLPVFLDAVARSSAIIPLPPLITTTPYPQCQRMRSASPARSATSSLLAVSLPSRAFPSDVSADSPHQAT